MILLVLNAGSSSLKFALFQQTGREGDRQVLVRGSVERIGSPQTVLKIKIPEGFPDSEVKGGDAQSVLNEVITRLQSGQLQLEAGTGFDAVGVRVVHGGDRFTQPTLISQDVLQAIRDLSQLAPLHNKSDADAIATVQRSLPNVPVWAVFDTAFHHDLPLIAATYAIPHELSEQYKLRRYGFHGISHRYVADQLASCLGRNLMGTRLITCHLGSGASVCAIRDGHSLDISMGLTPLEGLEMGTRSGDVDAGLVLFLLRRAGLDVDGVEDVLNHKSGLLGVSGLSADVRDLEKAAQAGNERATLALDLFAYRVSKTVGAYAVALGGVDAIAFSGGIGERSVGMRAKIMARLGVLGLQLDADANANADGTQNLRLSPPNSQPEVWVIPTDEEAQIANEVFAASVELSPG